MILVCLMLRFKPLFPLSSFTLIKRLLSSSSHFAIRVISSVYLRLLVFLPAVLITACDSPSLAFCLMYYAFSSVQLCPTLCNPMNRSTPGLPVHHQLPESTQTHVHCVGDAIQPSHPLSSPSPPALNFSQHQGLFK